MISQDSKVACRPRPKAASSRVDGLDDAAALQHGLFAAALIGVRFLPNIHGIGPADGQETPRLVEAGHKEAW